MIGTKKPSDIKAEIREAFAKKGIDVETWLDEQMAKMKAGPRREPGVLESLRLMRNGLRDELPTPPRKKKASGARVRTGKA